MTYVSHLPQLYAILLANLLDRHDAGHLLSCYGGGLDGQLRLAASPYAMWGDVLRRNAANMRVALTELRDMIDVVLPLLEPGRNPEDFSQSPPSLEAWFHRANIIHRQFEDRRSEDGAYPPLTCEEAS